MLEKSVGKERFASGKEPVRVCVCVCVGASWGSVVAAVLARHWLRPCSCCDIGGARKKATISNSHSGSWVAQ